MSVSSLGQYYPLGGQVLGGTLGNGEGWVRGDSADGGAVLAADATCYSPSAILGPRDQNTASSVAMVGDSIMEGTGDAYPVWGQRGFTWRAINEVVGSVSLAKGSEKASDFQGANSDTRLDLASYCTDAVVNYGTNDVGASASLATIQANLQRIWADLAGRGLRVYQATILPRTRSTDGWLTTAGQSPYGTASQEAVRVRLNDWLRTVPAPLSGIFDTADAIESARNSGYWKAPAAQADSGTASATSTAAILVDPTKAWKKNQYQGFLVRIASGTGAGQIREIKTTSGYQLILTSPWATVPDATSTYVIYQGYTVEGIHPTLTGHVAMSKTVRAFPAVANVVNNGDPGYSETGTWWDGGNPGGTGYRGDYRGQGSSASVATFTVPGLAPGAYKLLVTWTKTPDRATNAPYTVLDGSASLGTFRVDQTLSPADEQAGNVGWKALGTFNVTSGSLSVRVGGPNNSYVVADAIRVVPVADLAWSQAPVSPAAVDASAPFAVSVAYKVALTTVGADFKVGYWLSTDDVFGNPDDAYLGSQTLVSAGAKSVGDHVAASPPLSVAQPGSYYVFARLDDANAVAESDERNNVAAPTRVTVRRPERAPVASPQFASAVEDTARPIALGGSDADGDPLTFAVTTGPAHGTLTVNPDGTYTYMYARP